MEKINEATKLAAKILQENTEYIVARNIIDAIFEQTKSSASRTSIRLTVIDSYYSTNMSKRVFGLNDLSEAIEKIGTDKEIMLQANQYLKTGNGKIHDLLKAEYGIRKYGKKAGEARSLISKYLYFLMGHNFPIEDSLVKNYVNTIFHYFNISEIDTENLIVEIAKASNEQECSYDEMDNLLWLFGKMINGSLSLIVKKDVYLEIIRAFRMTEKISSKEFDKMLSEKLRKKTELDKIRRYISSDLNDFLKFCKEVMVE